MKSRDEERVAECKTLIDDIQNFFVDLEQGDRTFVEQIATRLESNNPFVTDKDYRKIQDIHERVC